MRTRLTFFLADALALAVVGGVLWLGGRLLGVEILVPLLLPVPALLVVAFALRGLYRADALHPAEELRRVWTMTAVTFAPYAVAACKAYSVSTIPAYVPILELAAAGGLCFLVIPTSRAFSRALFAPAPWWGTGVVVIASGMSARRIVRTLKCWPELGLKPVAVLHDAPDADEVEGVPVVGHTHLAPRIASAYGVPYAIVVLPDLSTRQLSERVRRYRRFYERVLVVPDLPSAPALWTSSQRVDGLLGYSVRHWASGRMLRAAKRVVDLAFALAALVVLSPFLILIAALIKLDTPGPVLFLQTRLGLEGRCFPILKFRSMYTDAEARLQTLLERDPVRREEYERYHKLKDDPRVTSVGRFLRKYSLDELPQFANVVVGHLSLVGPRAYLPRELSTMGGVERAVLQGRPGITGLWQVSGRNCLPFEERLTLDIHYVQNWTPALDLYILAKTLPVILRGEGAA